MHQSGGVLEKEWRMMLCDPQKAANLGEEKGVCVRKTNILSKWGHSVESRQSRPSVL